VEQVLLARHGESEFSVRKAMNGDPAVANALTPAGVEQARRLGEQLAGDPLDLCVTSEFPRAQQTADVALAGRQVPRLVLRDLNDIRVGDFEGGLLADYRHWAHTHGPEDEPPGAGESRAEAVRRYVRAFRAVRARPERLVLVVAHSLPIRYVVNAAEEEDPAPSVEQVDYAVPYRLAASELERALERLDAWAAAPSWKLPT
jgi:2,3-bisphosphoglycerate-dependent phosphoglycerate mutase